LGDADRGFANNLIDIGANARLREADGQNGAIEGLCK
jgi:hypothetical protein